MSTSALPTIRIRLPTEGERDFMERHGATVGVSGIFVPSLNLRPVGTRVRLIVEMKDGKVGISGEAEIAEHAKPGARPGMKVRMVTLDPGSFPVRLGSPPPPSQAPKGAEDAVPRVETPAPDAAMPNGDAREPVAAAPVAQNLEPAPPEPPAEPVAPAPPSTDLTRGPGEPTGEMDMSAARAAQESAGLNEITRRRNVDALVKSTLSEHSEHGQDGLDTPSTQEDSDDDSDASPLNPSDLERTQFETAENVQAAIAAMREEAARRSREDTRSIPKAAVVAEAREEVLNEPLKPEEKTRQERVTAKAPRPIEPPAEAPGDPATDSEDEDDVPQLSQEHPTGRGEDEPIDELLKHEDRGTAEQVNERLENARALWALLVVLLVACGIVLWALTRS